MVGHINRRPSKPTKKRRRVQVSGTVHTINDDGTSSTQRVKLGPHGVAKSEAEAALERAHLLKTINAVDKETLIREAIYDDGDYPSASGAYSDASMGLGSDSEDEDDEPGTIELARRKEEEERITFCKEVYYEAIADASKPEDHRTRRDRTQRSQEAWSDIYPSLVDTYLRFELNGSADIVQKEEMYDPITVIDVFETRAISFPIQANEECNITLARHGYLGTSPISPQTAISFRCLKLYHTLAGRTPQLSIQAFVSSLCDMHSISYRPYLRTQFSSAYDAYVQILRLVRERIDNRRARDTEDWLLRQICPCCTYKLQDEKPLKYDMLMALDGNNSLKRVGRRRYERDTDGKIISAENLEHEDPREYKDKRYVHPAVVDVCQYKVKSRKRQVNGKGTKKAAADAFEDSPVGGIDDPLPCVDRWKNLAAEEKKKMWGIFSETGIFVMVCRHGMLFLYCDMIKSGELAKYPLALIKKALEIFDTKIQFGYDIGCSFTDTANNSELVRPLLERTGSTFCVGSFHGHAHCRLCQVDWHPLYIDGVGLEDFESCERVFSRSNYVAITTRHASVYHRHQSVTRHFDVANDDRFRDLGNFLCNNYKQANNLVITLTAQLEKAKRDLNIPSNDVFEQRHKDEKVYLRNVKEEDPEDVLKMEYVRTLQHLASTELEFFAADNCFLNATPTELRDEAYYTSDICRTSTIERSCGETITELAIYSKSARDFEARLKTERWNTDSVEYTAAARMIATREYQQVLNRLEGLVVSRLFELEKLNNSGTCYNMREKLAKALQSRSKTIRHTIGDYNEAAAKVVPPRPSLDAATVLDYVYLGEFDLLRDSRYGIQEQPWAKAANREVNIIYFKLKRAREELERVEIEMRRLRTFMRDEEAHYAKVIEAVKEHEPELVLQLQRMKQRHSSVRAVHSTRMKAVEEELGIDRSSRYGKKLGMGVEEEEQLRRFFNNVVINDDNNDGAEEDLESRDNTFSALMTFASAD